MKTIVTAGVKNADIDVFACAIAYAELLKLEGKQAVPVIPGEFTSTITPSILDWGAKYETVYKSQSDERFVIVDISDPDQLPAFVDTRKVDEVYDHRHGYEQHWEHLGGDKHIEMVGACGTLMWEQFEKRGQVGNISQISAKLLLASIVSNNLAFRSPLTTDRDRSAYTKLSKITDLGDTWVAEYSREQEEILLKNFEQYLKADIKRFNTPIEEFVIAQAEVWDATELLETKTEEMARIMTEFEPHPWIVNILNIGSFP